MPSPKSGRREFAVRGGAPTRLCLWPQTDHVLRASRGLVHPFCWPVFWKVYTTEGAPPFAIFKGWATQPSILYSSVTAACLVIAGRPIVRTLQRIQNRRHHQKLGPPRGGPLLPDS